MLPSAPSDLWPELRHRLMHLWLLIVMGLPNVLLSREGKLLFIADDAALKQLSVGRRSRPGGSTVH